MTTAMRGFGALEFEIGERPSVVVSAFAALWTLGWLINTVLGVIALSREPTFTGMAAWLFWICAGPVVMLALVWAACGRRERLSIQANTVRLERYVWRIRRTVVVAQQTIRQVRVEPRRPRPTAVLTAVREFWLGGAGRIALESGGRVYAFGATLSDDSVGAIVRALATDSMRAPAIEHASKPLLRPAWHRWATGTLMTVVLLPTFDLPIAAAVDRATCFGVDTASTSPQTPIDVSRLHPDGRVLLVPLDDFPPAMARQLADHFERRFGTPVDVAQTAYVPDDFFVSWRGQWDAEALLDELAQRFPKSDPRRVVIALTTGDIYMPSTSWGYVFSARNARLAVVSSARMSHACGGIVTATPERQLMRLRKMTGKMVGVLYYGLDVNNDPASLLYGSIGGPQELDAMSDSF